MESTTFNARKAFMLLFKYFNGKDDIYRSLIPAYTTDTDCKLYDGFPL